jgi:hypothetical protein
MAILYELLTGAERPAPAEGEGEGTSGSPTPIGTSA